MTTNNDESHPTLPGLELEAPDSAPSSMRRAVITTLEALKADGLLEPRHQAVAQLCLELADAVAAGRRGGRASAAAMAAAQLLSALDSLPKPASIEATARLDDWLAKLSQPATP